MTTARRRAWGVIAPVALLAAALPLCGIVVVRQAQVHRLDAEITRYERGETSVERIEGEAGRASACRLFCPAELSLLVAIAQLDVAQRDASAHARAAQAARIAARRALSDRPGWGPALAVAAATEQEAGASDTALALLVRSYEVAPYLRAQALWRLRFVAARWPQLGEKTRDAAMREAVWMARLGWFDKQAVLNALGDSPAAVRFSLLMPDPADQP